MEENNGKPITTQYEAWQTLAVINERTKNIDKQVVDLKNKVIDYKEFKNDVSWLKTFFWYVASGTIVAIIGVIVNIAIK